jgi:hypothetical protein
MKSTMRTVLAAAGGVAAAGAAAVALRRLFSGPRQATAVVTIGAPIERIVELLDHGQLGELTAAAAPDALDAASMTITPAPGDRGTEIRLTSDRLDAATLKRTLYACKAELETGEIPTGKRTR